MHFGDKEYLNGAAERYKAFLYLQKQQAGTATTAGGGGTSSGVQLVPTLDIDLLWHCHQLCTLEYRQDCQAVFGHLIGHDDNIPGAGGGKPGALPGAGAGGGVGGGVATSAGKGGGGSGIAGTNIASPGFAATSSLWESTFLLPYARAGSLARGSQPPSFAFPKAPEKSGGKGGGLSPSDTAAKGGGSSGGNSQSSVSGSSHLHSRGAASSPTSSAGSSSGGGVNLGAGGVGVGRFEGGAGSSGSAKLGTRSPREVAPKAPPSGVPPRHTMEAVVDLHYLRGLRAPKSEVFVRLVPVLHGSGTALTSAKVLPATSVGGGDTLGLGDRFHLVVDRVTQGLAFQVCVTVSSGFLKKGGEKVLGEARILWKDVLDSPGYTLTKPLQITPTSSSTLPLSGSLKGGGGGGGGGGAMTLGVSLSLTPPVLAPLLFALQVGPPTDDAGYQISPLVAAATKSPQEGRWLSFPVTDHTQEFPLLIRVKMVKGSGAQAAKVAPEGKRVVLQKGPWQTGPKVKVPFAGGGRIEELWQLRTTNMDTTRTWLASSGWSVTVLLSSQSQRESSAQRSSRGASAQKSTARAAGAGGGEGGGGVYPSSLSTSGRANPHPSGPVVSYMLSKVPGAPAALAPGRWLQYSTAASGYEAATPDSDASVRRAAGGPEDASASAGFVTLIRYTRDAPQGVATALLNWQTGCVEVAPGERWDLVLLLSVAVCQSWFDLVIKEWRKPVIPKGLKSTQLTKDDEWGCLVAFPSPSASGKLGSGSSAGSDGGAVGTGAGAPLPWYAFPTQTWNGVSVYNQTEVGGSCALIYSTGAGV